MAVQIQFRHDTAANWTSANPILATGEMGIETDTDKFKIGDGVATWSALPYGGIQGATGVAVQPEAPASTDVLWLDSDDPAEPIPVPAGGTTGQVLAKASGDDFDSEWVTKADVPLSTVTTAGDLIVADGASSVTRLGIGAADTVLTSNGTTATWAALGASGGMELISSGTPSSSGLIFSSIPQTYKRLILIGENLEFFSSNRLQINLRNGGTTLNMGSVNTYVTSSAETISRESSIRTTPSIDGEARFAFSVTIDNYSSANNGVTYQGAFRGFFSGAYFAQLTGGGSITTSAVDSIQITGANNYFNVTGTIYLYGVN